MEDVKLFIFRRTLGHLLLQKLVLLSFLFWNTFDLIADIKQSKQEK